jgi:hypothetical protein
VAAADDDDVEAVHAGKIDGVRQDCLELQAARTQRATSRTLGRLPVINRPTR